MMRHDSSDDEPAARPITRLLQERLDATSSGRISSSVRDTGDYLAAQHSSIFTEAKSFGSTLTLGRKTRRDREDDPFFGHDQAELDHERWYAEEYVEKLVMQQLGGNIDFRRDFRLGRSYDADTMLGALDGTERVILALKRGAVTSCTEAISKLREHTKGWPKEKMSASTIVQEMRERDRGLKDIIDVSEFELGKLTLPASQLIAERKYLIDALDFLSLVGGQEFPIRRAVEILSLSTKCKYFSSLPSDAMDHLRAIRVELRSAVSELVHTDEPEKLRASLLASVFSAAHLLGSEQELLSVLVDQLPVFRAPLVTTCTSAEDPKDDPDASKALEPLETARWECFDAFRSALRLAVMIPSKKKQFLETLAIELVRRRIAPVAQAILCDLEGKTASSRAAKDRQKNDEASYNVLIGRRRFLIALAEVVHMIGDICQTFSMQCLTECARSSGQIASEPYSDHCTQELIESGCYGIESFVASFPMAEKGWLEDVGGGCFADIPAIELHGARLIPLSASDVEDSLRYRLHFLRILDQLPSMTSQAITKAQESLRRCAMVLSPNFLHSGKSDSEKNLESFDPDNMLIPRDASDPRSRRKSPIVHRTMRDVGEVLVMSFLAAVETLLQGAVHLIPQSARSADEKGELWSGSNSPLVTYSRVLVCVALSGEKIDSFLRTLDKEEVNSLDKRTRSIDNVVKLCFSVSARRELRRELRNSLKDLARDADAGLDTACSAAGPYLRAVLSRGQFGNRAKSASPRKSAQAREANQSFDEDPLAGFLKSQIESVASFARGQHLTRVLSHFAGHIKDVVLQYWADPSTPFSHTATADAAAILRCFLNYPEAAMILSPLKCAASLMQESPGNLWGLLTQIQETNLAYDMARELLQKRKDASHEDETTKAIMVLSLHNEENDSQSLQSRVSVCREGRSLQPQ